MSGVPRGSSGSGSARDLGVDVVRAVAIAGVVLGHWLVTGLVVGDDGALRGASPLVALDAFRPVTWLFQTLGLFFLAGGFAAAYRRRGDADPAAGAPPATAPPTGGRSAVERARSGFGRRLATLAGPLGAVLGLLAVALLAGALAGVPEESLRTVGKLVLSPLWFLLPFLALTAATRPIVAVVRRWGPLPLVAGGVVVVAVSDVGIRLGHAWPTGWALPVTLVAGWLVPYALGVALALGRSGNRGAGARRTGWILLLGGAGAVAALVFVAGYPASAVGVPGDARSNLDPPSLACLALGVAQAGLVVLLLPRLRRLGALPRLGRSVAAVNRHALPIYLWHQTALIVVTVGAAWLVGRTPGLLAAPDGLGWAAARVAWLPVFAVTLFVIVRTAAVARRPRPPATQSSDETAPADPPSRHIGQSAANLPAYARAPGPSR